MEQSRRPASAQWYHETQLSAHNAVPLEPEAAEAIDVFWLGMSEQIDAALANTLAPHRPVFCHSRLCYRLLFPQRLQISRCVTLSLYERLSAALAAAQAAGVQRLCSHYAARLAPLDSPDASRASNIRQTLITQYARQLAGQPMLIAAAASAQLIEAGLSQQDIVTFAHIVGFISYQARIVAGVAALSGRPAAAQPDFTSFEDAAAAPAMAGIRWFPHPSLQPPENLPPPAVLAPEARIRPLYYPLLNHDSRVLEQWHAIGHLIRQRSALPAELMELIPLVVARINGCAFRAVLHRQRYEQLTQDGRLTALLCCGIHRVLEELSPDTPVYGVINAVAELTRTPEKIRQTRLLPLRVSGYNRAAQFEIILLCALLVWENRLMQMLGETAAAGGK